MGGDGVGTHHPFGNAPQRLVFGIEGFECRTSLVVPSLVKPAGHGTLHLVDLGFQIEVPGYVPLSPQPVLPAYFIFNTSRYRRPGS
jgi:hypothetical protein